MPLRFPVSAHTHDDRREANMGLLDIFNGMQNGPRGNRGLGDGGMSPITMALLGLLAYKAVKGFGDNPNPAQPGTAPSGPGAISSRASAAEPAWLPAQADLAGS